MVSRGGGVLRLCMALAACALALPALADAAPKRAELERSMRQLLRSEAGPPAALAVIQRGRSREVVAVGRARLGAPRAPRARDHMRIASVAKAFSGAVALQLVREGVLSLDATIGELLPDLPASWHEITLAQLLGHTSGLPDFSQSEAFRDAVGASPQLAPAPEALLDFVADKDPIFPPGTDYQYSNSDNVAVALMVEAVTGSPYEQVLARRVLGPWGLRQTSLGPGILLPKPFWHGYSAPPREDVSQLVAFGGWAWASGGIVSTPGDLNRFVRRYVRLRHGPFLPGGKSDPPGPGSNSAGLAIFRYRTRCGTVFGHTGSILGYTQLIAAGAGGKRSLTFTISTQVTPELVPSLRRAQTKAVCYLLRGRKGR